MKKIFFVFVCCLFMSNNLPAMDHAKKCCSNEEQTLKDQFEAVHTIVQALIEIVKNGNSPFEGRLDSKLESKLALFNLQAAMNDDNYKITAPNTRQILAPLLSNRDASLAPDVKEAIKVHGQEDLASITSLLNSY
jgi:hypothetical protein